MPPWQAFEGRFAPGVNLSPCFFDSCCGHVGVGGADAAAIEVPGTEQWAFGENDARVGSMRLPRSNVPMPMIAQEKEEMKKRNVEQVASQAESTDVKSKLGFSRQLYETTTSYIVT